MNLLQREGDPVASFAPIQDVIIIELGSTIYITYSDLPS